MLRKAILVFAILSLRNIAFACPTDEDLCTTTGSCTRLQQLQAIRECLIDPDTMSKASPSNTGYQLVQQIAANYSIQNVSQAETMEILASAVLPAVVKEEVTEQAGWSKLIDNAGPDLTGLVQTVKDLHLVDNNPEKLVSMFSNLSPEYQQLFLLGTPELFTVSAKNDKALKSILQIATRVIKTRDGLAYFKKKIEEYRDEPADSEDDSSDAPAPEEEIAQSAANYRQGNICSVVEYQKQIAPVRRQLTRTSLGYQDQLGCTVTMVITPVGKTGWQGLVFAKTSFSSTDFTLTGKTDQDFIHALKTFSFKHSRK